MIGGAGPLVSVAGITPEFSPELSAEELGLPRSGPDFEALSGMIEEAAAAASPAAVFRECAPCGKTEDSVEFGGEVFAGRALAANLAGASRVFPYVATCGNELERWSRQFSDPLLSYFAAHIMEAALGSALKSLYSRIKTTCGVRRYATMAPGSLENWPLEQQSRLFRVLGGGRPAGVELTERFLMLPSKSASGILFPAVEPFESCMLCARENCPSRRAPYDEARYVKIYGNIPGAR